jgi:DNA-binding MarR family transcriptional regulator
VAKAGVSVSDLEKVLITLPPSVQAIYQILSHGNPMSVTDIYAQAPYCQRTVHEALRFLERENLITKSPNLHDMRRCLYQASPL